MTATQMLRKEVKKYIDKADDKSLRMVKAILEIEQEETEDEDEAGMEPENFDDLPPELQRRIDMAIKEGEEGKGITYEKFKEQHSQWFSK